MDPRKNPYTPNAGAVPPALAGREAELQSFALLLGRLQNGNSEQSMVITGLRGVGKTVLLNRFREEAEGLDWAVAEMEVSKHDDEHFRRLLTANFRQVLYRIAPKARWKGRVLRAAGVLRSFSIAVDPEGNLTAGLSSTVVEGTADSGLLSMDLPDLVVAVGEAARDHDTGVVLLIDEIQFLSRGQFEALIMGLHRAVQRQLPVTLVGAGLPQLAELAGEAKSYSERLFKFPAIGRLGDDDARLALADPAARLGLAYDDDAVARALEFTEGYPYFLQEIGYAVWNIADPSGVTAQNMADAQRLVEAKLDESFFRVRIDRTTDLEKAYLRAMAELGADPQLAGAVAEKLGRTSQQCGPTRSQLIDKGLLYTPSHGFAAFTVPQFDRFLKRYQPNLEVPEVRRRRNRT